MSRFLQETTDELLFWTVSSSLGPILGGAAGALGRDPGRARLGGRRLRPKLRNKKN
jgi:hypothetical protein